MAARTLVQSLFVLGIASLAHAQCGTWTPIPGDTLTGLTAARTAAMIPWDPDGPVGPQPERMILAGTYGSGGMIKSWTPSTGQWAGMGGSTQKYCLAIHNGIPYAGGSYDHGCCRIEVWSGTSFGSMFFFSSGGGPSALCSYNGELYASGDWTTTSGGTNISRYNGSTWSQVGAGLVGGALAMTVHSGQLIVGGSFSVAGGAPAANIAAWDGSQWSTLGTGIGGTVNAMCVYGGDLIAAGNFTTAGGATVSNIARWDGQTWLPLGSDSRLGPSTPISALTVFRNQLVVGGGFSAVGDLPASRVATWDRASNSWAAMSDAPPTNVASLGVIQEILLAGVSRVLPADVSVLRWNPIVLPELAQPIAPATVGAATPLVLTATPVVGAAELPGGLAYQWLRNGFPLVNGGGGASPGGGIVFNATGTITTTQPLQLTLQFPRPSDAGNYSIRLTNACGTRTSASTFARICLADFNGGGAVTVQDIFDFLNAWFASDPSADFNGAFGITVGDIFDFLNAWFVGC